MAKKQRKGVTTTSEEAHVPASVEGPEPEAKPEKLKEVKSGDYVVLADGEDYQYLDIQTRTSRGESLTRVYFRKIAGNTMEQFSPDDKTLKGFKFIRP